MSEGSGRAVRNRKVGASGDETPGEGAERGGAGGRERDEDGRGDAETAPNDASDGRSQGEGEGNDKPHKGLLQRPALLGIMGLGIALAIVGGVLFWLHARRFETTDDAFIDAHITRLAPQISGRVTKILVDDNARVRAGQLLVEIDSADVETRVAQADAQRAQAQAQADNARVQIAVDQAAYQQALADAAAASAQADNASRDLARYQTLLRLNARAVAQQQLDQATDLALQTRAQRLSALRAAKSRAEQIRAAETQVKSGEDQVRAAEAVLKEADVNLGYTKIIAPVDGHVAQKSVAVGAFVQPGTELLAVVPTELWVTANFKETQLASIRLGQPVAIKVDACPKTRVRGHVESIERGSGQAFGVLPPENATGNFVKVVQRVPVKIVFDDAPNDCPYGPGMSVVPRVQVR